MGFFHPFLRRRYRVNESADGEGSESPGDIEDTGFERDVYLYADSDWTVMLTDLDRYREDGDNRYEYYYYISEPDIMYYETDPEKSNMGPVNSGELWVTNRRNEVEQYSLPATGGRGRLPFTIAGLILATGAIIGEEQYRKRRRGR